MEENMIKKSEIFNYSFYDDANNLTVVVNEKKLKQIFNADTILLQEYEHK